MKSYILLLYCMSDRMTFTSVHIPLALSTLRLVLLDHYETHPLSTYRLQVIISNGARTPSRFCVPGASWDMECLLTGVILFNYGVSFWEKSMTARQMLWNISTV